MKKFAAIFSLILILLTATSVFNGAMASEPPPPPPGHGETGNVTPPGGGAPVGSGIALLISLGAAYGYKKYRSAQNED